MNTIKNCYSPAGMGYWVSSTLRHLKDCPACKHGTMDRRERRDTSGKLFWSGWVCADCGHQIKDQG
jgi:transposase-like protein